MSELRESLLILYSLPLYAFVIGAEILFSCYNEKRLYSAQGTLSNIVLSVMNMVIDIVLRGICLLVLNYFFMFRVVDFSFSPLLYWPVLIVSQDFMYYWLHRVDHHCRLFWAVHVTHHSSEEFNLSVGFRSSVLQPLYRFVYFIPLAFFGFSGIDIMFAYSATQIFGILVHTQTIKKMGMLEHVLVTPSHHRVHHACNPLYLDRNMGMLLIIWDKLFGTFQAEDDAEPARFGLTKNIKTQNPVTVVTHEWKNIAGDLVREDIPLKAKLMYVFGPPGWSHDGSRKTSGQLRESSKRGDTR